MSGAFIGKQVLDSTYTHVDALAEFDPAVVKRVATASSLAQVTMGQEFNVVKLHREPGKLTLLDYPSFFDEAFPALRRYWTVDIDTGTVRYRTYDGSLNPPILHRKELLLAQSHPRRDEFAELTRAAEQIGLFDDTTRIGFRQAWQSLLQVKGYRVVGHHLVPLGNDERDGLDEPVPNKQAGIARHLTALTRYGLSAPMQTLARYGLLDGSKTVFDYGCGRGDDLRGLLENGIEAAGWDPYYRPDGLKQTAQRDVSNRPCVERFQRPAETLIWGSVLNKNVLSMPNKPRSVRPDRLVMGPENWARCQCH